MTTTATTTYLPNARISVCSTELRFLNMLDRRGQGKSAPRAVDFMFIDFQSGITASMQPVYNAIEAMGRPERYLVYQGTENRKIGFTARFLDQTRYGEAYDHARWLQMLCLSWQDPDTELGYQVYFPPPDVVLTLGRNGQNQDLRLMNAVTGKLTSCQVSYVTPRTPQGIPQTVVCAIEIAATDALSGEFQRGLYDAFGPINSGAD